MADNEDNIRYINGKIREKSADSVLSWDAIPDNIDFGKLSKRYT